MWQFQVELIPVHRMEGTSALWSVNFNRPKCLLKLLAASTAVSLDPRMSYTDNLSITFDLMLLITCNRVVLIHGLELWA
jgi:lipopolysaccharide/colanic/teichoic acid biosynthesis glycosyltransferase